MRRAIIPIIFLFALQSVHAQNSKYDSLKHLLSLAKDDSTRLVCLDELFNAYVWSYPDSSLIYVQQQILLANQIKSDIDLLAAYFNYSWFYILIGEYPKAVQTIHRLSKLAEKTKNFIPAAQARFLLAVVYGDEGNQEEAISNIRLAKTIMESNWRPLFRYDNTILRKSWEFDTVTNYIVILGRLAQTYERFGQLDSALKYVQISNDVYTKYFGKMDWTAIPFIFGNIYSKKGEHTKAIQYYHSGIVLSISNNINKDLIDNYNGIATTFKKMDNLDSSIFYAAKVLEVGNYTHYSMGKLEALNLLANIYKSKNNNDSLARYLDLTIAAKDSLFGLQKVMEIQNISFNEQLRQQEEVQQHQELKKKIKLDSLLAALVVFLVIAFILYRNNRHKQKAYALLQKQKQEIDTQKSKVEQALEELKATQAQLIQSEKMASLGELTAGIAHEIQNPLNFVNNFSEVSVELADELKEKLNKTELQANEKKNIEMMIDDLVQNQQKINHHGKRADSIVKGMLEHSRTSTGQKELKDINELADEYLRLSYHGLRAKDKTFNATLQTDFDENVGKIYIISQDIGRVFLNLFTNAFYSVSQKKKRLSDASHGEQPGFEPTVCVSTKKLNSKVEIRVRDNGAGVPQKVIDKIFQPFFTTKPVGEGTGLGLSLSYDIIKAHGGEIKVETKEGECAEFVIVLPAKERQEG